MVNPAQSELVLGGQAAKTKHADIVYCAATNGDPEATHLLLLSDRRAVLRKALAAPKRRFAAEMVSVGKAAKGAAHWTTTESGSTLATLPQ